jgi:S-adenosylmethionine:tRNA ribosyltransferase-isomerase
MLTNDLDFALPAELIAQSPAGDRADSRLLHYRRCDRSIEHRRFRDLPALLHPGDLLVFNDSKVLPARFVLIKATGGRVEGLFVEETEGGRWSVLLKNAGPASVGTALHFEGNPSFTAVIEQRMGDGMYQLRVTPPGPAAALLERLGRMPLPPYIHRDRGADPRDALDRQRYQTVYARTAGSVAAPTAGLHFTAELIDSLKARGIETAMLTLHVGPGTFKPVSAETLAGHVMHEERYVIGDEAAAALNRAAERSREGSGGRIVAVGTTSARVLESHPAGQPWQSVAGRTSIFIYPPYAWKHVGALITNFHLPRSTLIALVAAMTGLEEQRRIYRVAIEERYRFFSYGDALFID